MGALGASRYYIRCFQTLGSYRMVSREGFPESPCVDICTLDDDDLCVGCGRSLDQISRWALMSREEQWAVVESLGAPAVAGSAE